ncbi:MAG: haloacid dehalogenase [Planctomycetes bacterium RBG_16_64_10]|nr:MAG: haloacid dehalogenase [Planctomycetes bacterium RBG_16_64_10]
MNDLKLDHDFFVGIDSDGCVFDTMELKHKECFIPSLIKHYNLQGVSKYAREAAEFVNLYSKSRGINRFPALVEELEWLRRRPEVRARGVPVPVLNGLMRWVGTELRLGNPALEKAARATSDPDLVRALAWSKAVNKSIAEMVRGVPPFPYVRECLAQLARVADLLVVSATPTEALHSEWHEHQIAQYVRAIHGQEHGTKKDMLTAAAKYPAGGALMVGDAPGDCKAAMANKCLFFPINPGTEETSWKRLLDEGIPRLLNGTFAGDYQNQLLAEFDACLPERPPWPVEDD